MSIKQQVLQFTTGGVSVLLYDNSNVYLYTARIVGVAGTRVLVNRFSETEVCCHNRRKKYREVIELDNITKIEGNKVYLK